MGREKFQNREFVKPSPHKMSLARPQLRGLLASKLRRDFIAGFAFSFVCAGAWYMAVKRSRINRYEEFHKSFDPQADFIRMREAGVFTSVMPGGEANTDGW